MRSPVGRPPRARSLGLLALGACTVWLVVQNSVLLGMMVWRSEAREVAIAAEVLLRAAAKVAVHAWATPLPGVLLATLVVAAVGAVLFAGPGPGREVRHG